MRRLIAVFVVLLGAAFLAAGPANPAQAAAPDTSNCNYPAMKCACPTLSVSTTVPAVGESIDVSGTDFSPSTSISLVLKPVRDTPSDREFTVGTVTSDSNGSFSTSITMPAQAIGTYDLHAVGGTSESVRESLGCPADPSQRLRIGGDNDSNRNPNSNPPDTAFTGFNMLWLLLLAAVLIALGVYAVRRGRKGETVRSIHG